MDAQVRWLETQTLGRAALLAGWTAVVSAIWTFLDPAFAPLGISGLFLIALFAMAFTHPYVAWAGTGMVLALYGVLQTLVERPPDLLIPHLAGATVAWLGTLGLARWFVQHVRRVSEDLEHSRRLVDALSVPDPKTGLVKWPFARQTLRTEVERSRRYQNPLALLLIEVGPWGREEVPPPSVLEGLEIQLAQHLARSLRAIDTPFRLEEEGIIGAILPETDAQGAEVVARRLVQWAAKELRIPVSVGVAIFPDDGVVDQELLRSARQALEQALREGQEVAYAPPEASGEAPSPTIAPPTPTEEPVEPPLPNLHTLQLAEEIREAEVRFMGLQDPTELRPYERALLAQQGVARVQMVVYPEGVLGLRVHHRFLSLAPLLHALHGVQTVEAEDEAGRVWTVRIGQREAS